MTRLKIFFLFASEWSCTALISSLMRWMENENLIFLHYDYVMGKKYVIGKENRRMEEKQKENTMTLGKSFFIHILLCYERTESMDFARKSIIFLHKSRMKNSKYIIVESIIIEWKHPQRQNIKTNKKITLIIILVCLFLAILSTLFYLPNGKGTKILLLFLRLCISNFSVWFTNFFGFLIFDSLSVT